MIDVKLQPDEKLIQLVAKEVQTTSHGKFTAFQAVQKDKRLMDCKFITAINMKPVTSCYILVKTKDINIDRNRLYPVLWVRHILNIFIDDSDKADKEQRDAAEVEDTF